MSDMENDNIEDKLDFELEPLSDEGEEAPEMDAEDDSEVDPALQMQITRLQEEVETLEQLIQRPPLLQSTFPAAVSTDGSFTELLSLNGTLSDFADGRTGSVIALTSGQAMLVEIIDPPAKRFIKISGGGSATAGVFEVLVKHNGDDGDSYPLYDVYAATDSGLTTALNLSGALPPIMSEFRGISGLGDAVTAAGDGSEGLAHYEPDGTVITLDTVSGEAVCTSPTTATAGAV